MNSFYKLIKKDKKVYQKWEIIDKIKIFRHIKKLNNYNFHVKSKSIQIKRFH